MTTHSIMTANDVDRDDLSSFLGRFYSQKKVRFLREHGEWWHRGDDNRWVVLEDGRVAAYCAIIPGKVRLGGRVVDVAWWVDLIVAPEYRGRGLQRLFDERVKGSAPLILGFPNALAAAIHRKHGWGVSEDLRVALCPLRPAALGFVRRSNGPRGLVLRMLAGLAGGPAWVFRRRFAAFQPLFAHLVEDPAPSTLARVAGGSGVQDAIETVRSEEWIRWRFFENPFRDDLRFYGAGRTARDDLGAVVRYLPRERGTAARILDVFGAVEDSELTLDLMNLIVRDAARSGAVQVTVLRPRGNETGRLRRSGFVLQTKSRLCSWTFDEEIKLRIGWMKMYWNLADSDHDEP